MPASSSPQEIARQTENRMLLLKALRVLGIQQVQTRYGGKKGRCTHCLVSTTPLDKLLLLECPVPQYPGGDDKVPAPAPRELSLLDALKDFTLHWIGLESPDWTCDDGGAGVMSIEVTSGVFTLEHNAYFTENLCYRLKD